MIDPIPYSHFNNFIYRIPILPFNFSDLSFLHSVVFKEAILIASFDLWEEAFRKDKNQDLKMKLGLLKYFNRMRSRCTPFGLFAGVGTGEVGTKSEIIISGFNNYRSNTRLDMNYLCNLSQYLNSKDVIREQIHFYPNSSLYELWKRYRYVEYKYVNGKRVHTLSEIEYNENIKLVLDRSEKGAMRKELIDLLIQFNYEYLDALSFINDLIESQVLVSELDVQLTGGDMLETLIHKLEKISIEGDLLKMLKSIKEELSLIDKSEIGQKRDKYYFSIQDKLKKLNVEYEKKFIFQSDVYVTSTQISSTISIKVIEGVKEGIAILNKLGMQKEGKVENTLLKQFKDKFYKRYGDAEIRLVEALDTDIGLGFGQFTSANMNINNSLIDGILQLSKSQSKTEGRLNERVENLLMEKYIECNNNNVLEIIITEADVEQFSNSWGDLPATISAIVEVIQVGNEKDNGSVIKLNAIAMSSAANLLSRFSYMDDSIDNCIREIIEKESKIIENDSTIIAEIVHLPESRIGNVLFRTAHRTYEIPYLANHSVNNSNKISIKDLLVSVPSGKYIKLRSDRLKKNIVPRITSAHNFSKDSLPIYHFLGLMQFQGFRSSLLFDWGFLSEKSFLPRVRFKNVILSPAKWVITSEDLKSMPKITDYSFLGWAAELKVKKRIVDKVLLSQMDNKLLVDFNVPEEVQLLFSFSKGIRFVLEEAIFNLTNYDNSLVRDEEYSYYANEVIIPFYKN